MTKSRSEARQSGQLEKKLAAYTIAGAAALVAPGVAKADITYVAVNTTVSTSSIPNNLSFHSGDFTLTASSFLDPPTTGTVNEVSVGTTGSAQVLLDPVASSNVAALGFGSVIDPTVSSNWGGGGKLVGVDQNNSFFSGGDWPSNGDIRYLGLYFVGAGGPQAGWAEIATTANGSSASFDLIGYAFDNTANEAITAGEGAPVPEPSALPLLVLGGAGLIELRRRRAARN
ncbi:MAG TPA: PEP-CTERM sorting domain-containing protein [Bryobacteraceae bacterium]|nr:PEP-CTERM sorting domain-containing protein [Bryobacteraceae bacterium]